VTLTRRWAVVALVCASVCIGAFTLSPGGNASGSAAVQSIWQRVSCLTCSATWLADVIGNIALFIPLGAALIAVGVPHGRAVLVGSVVSLLIELLQLSGFPEGRTPAIADIVSNTIGTWGGVSLARHAAVLLEPRATRARALRNGWSIVLIGAWTAISIALRPATSVQARATTVASTLPFTPGYGWFAAEPKAARVNGVSVAHRGNGPVLVAARRTDSVVASVTVRGRDRRDGVVPIVFVHDPSMTSIDPASTRAHLLLGQHGVQASLTSDLLAGRWGLQVPELVARGAFPAGRDSVSLQAVVTARAWRLAWVDASEQAERVHEVTMRLSPALGWSLIQSAVPSSARAAVALGAVWLLAWFAPLGYWSAAATTSVSAHHRSYVRAALRGAVLLAITWIVARATGTSPLTWVQAAWCVSSAVAGATVWRVMARLAT